MNTYRFSWIAFLLLSSPAWAQGPFEGETLVSVAGSNQTQLIAMDHTVLATWNGLGASTPVTYLLDDGTLLRTSFASNSHFLAGGAAGRIQRIDANDNVLWDFEYSTADYRQHHDIEPMPNGNILMIAWEKKTAQEAIDAGRVGITGDMWPTKIIEVQPVGATGGNIVWEWHLWDHLIQDADPTKDNYGVVADHPELVDINFGDVSVNGDWDHANSIDYNEQLDQIIFCSPELNEFYVIDHSTTTEEAAGHSGGDRRRGGDILYRWGNPQAYGRGGAEDQVYFGVHGAMWIDPGLPGAGNILTYNNGNRPGSSNDFSSILEVQPPGGAGQYPIADGSAFGPAGPIWSYDNGPTFYSGIMSNAVRLPNGNTLICEAVQGFLFEVNTAGDMVWSYQASNAVFAVRRYWGTSTSVASPQRLSLLGNHPNPFNPLTTIRFSLDIAQPVSLHIYNAAGQHVRTLASQRHYAAGPHEIAWDGRDTAGHAVASGAYLYRLSTQDGHEEGRMTLVK